jgi:hypothetical protein
MAFFHMPAATNGDASALEGNLVCPVFLDNGRYGHCIQALCLAHASKQWAAACVGRGSQRWPVTSPVLSTNRFKQPRTIVREPLRSCHSCATPIFYDMFISLLYPPTIVERICEVPDVSIYINVCVQPWQP